MLEAPLAGNVDDPEGSLDALMQVPYSSCTLTIPQDRTGPALQRFYTQNSKQIYPEMKLHGLVSNSYIDVSVSDYVFPGPVCLFCGGKTGGPIFGIYKSLTNTLMWKLGLRPRSLISGNT